MSRAAAEPVVLAISIGDPAGIGPEVSVVGAARAKGARCVLVGDPTVVERTARAHRIAGKDVLRVTTREEARALRPGQIGVWEQSARLRARVTPGKPNRAGAAAQLRWIDQAVDLVACGACDALVTGPVDKSWIARSGEPGASRFRGHTEHIAERLGARHPVMAFWSERFTTSLASTHVPLADVPRAVTADSVARAIDELVRFLRDTGRSEPRVLVTGMNPHASDHGLIGKEEARKIAPGMRRATERLRRDGVRFRISGPSGAETAFRHAARGDYDGVVAMYHDQATIPMKLLGFGEAVNVTLGLRIVRTSVDHGVAHDIAGKMLADPRGMIEAIQLAATLVRGRRAPGLIERRRRGIRLAHDPG